MTITQRKIISGYSRGFQSDHHRLREDTQAVRTFGLFAAVLAMLAFLAVLWGTGLL